MRRGSNDFPENENKNLIFYPKKSSSNVTKCLPEIKMSDSGQLLELKVYHHGLSPLPMRNPCSKLILGIKSLFVKTFAAHITTNSVPNIVERIFCLPPT